MSMTLFTNAAADFAAQEQQISTLQQQLGTSVSVPTAEANPAAFTEAAQASSDNAILGAQQAAQTQATTNLGLGTTALQSASTVLDHVQSVILQATNAATNGADYQALSQQVAAARTQMLQLANTQSSNGNYVFAGTAATTQPFVENAAGSVQYFGTSGRSQVEIAPGISINTALNGDPFTTAFAGNGFASVTAPTSNTGDATLLATGVSNQGQASTFQQAGPAVTVSFASTASGGLSYTATQGGSTISTGTVAPASASSNQTINLLGMQFQLSGTPQSGDSFTISPARPQSVFKLMAKAVSTLAAPGATAAQDAQVRQTLGNLLGGIGQYQTLLAGTAARVGVSVGAIKQAANADTTRQTADQTTITNLTATKVPQTATELQQQINAFQAAMKAFASTSQLSLFKYI